MLRPWLPVAALLAITIAAGFSAYRSRFPHLLLYLAAASFLFPSFLGEQWMLGIYEERTDFPDGSVRFTINLTSAAISLMLQTLGWLLAIAGAFMQIRHTAKTTKKLDIGSTKH